MIAFGIGFPLSWHWITSLLDSNWECRKLGLSYLCNIESYLCIFYPHSVGANFLPHSHYPTYLECNIYTLYNIKIYWVQCEWGQKLAPSEPQTLIQWLPYQSSHHHHHDNHCHHYSYQDDYFDVLLILLFEIRLLRIVAQWTVVSSGGLPQSSSSSSSHCHYHQRHYHRHHCQIHT